MKTKRGEGFTPVEIMIVVSIIGLLALISVPSFAHARNIAQGVRVATDLKTFGHAFALYAMETGQFRVPGNGRYTFIIEE